MISIITYAVFLLCFVTFGFIHRDARTDAVMDGDAEAAARRGFYIGWCALGALYSFVDLMQAIVQAGS